MLNLIIFYAQWFNIYDHLKHYCSTNLCEGFGPSTISGETIDVCTLNNNLYWWWEGIERLGCHMGGLREIALNFKVWIYHCFKFWVVGSYFGTLTPINIDNTRYHSMNKHTDELDITWFWFPTNGKRFAKPWKTW